MSGAPVTHRQNASSDTRRGIALILYWGSDLDACPQDLACKNQDLTPEMSSFDLDAYLARVGWQGSLEPTLDTLARLTRAHITRIPFENVDVLLGRGIRIDLDSIVAKMVVAGRGGYCFSDGRLCQDR